MDQPTLISHIEEGRRGNFSAIGHALRAIVAGTFVDTSTPFGTAFAKATQRNVTFSAVLSEFRKPAATKDVLADAATGGILGVADSPGSPLLGATSIGSGTASTSDTATTVFTLPADYVAAANITVRVRAKVSALATVTATVDIPNAKLIGDGTLGADLCATAAQVLTTAYVNYDFTITGTSLVPGSMLNVDVLLTRDDTGGALTGAPSAVAVQFIVPIKT